MGNTNKSKKHRVLACLLALVLTVLSCLHAQFYLTFTAAVEDASLTNNINGAELEPVCRFQTDEETTQLYFLEGYLLWVSSCYWRYPSSITVEQEQESGEPVTVTADYYLTADHDIFLIDKSGKHKHDPHDFKTNIVIPKDRNNRRLRIFS